MISLRNVTRRFELGEMDAITPVRNVSLDIAAGEFIMITGRSGSGKSTLLNLTAGLIRPNSGEVLIEDVNLNGMSDREISRLRSQKMGFIFQFPSLLPSLTTLENTVMPATFVPPAARRDAHRRAAELLNTLGLAEKLDAYPRQLSAGEQKRAVIARSLINRPTVLLADEPTSDLDEQTEREVMGLLKEINASGVTLLMVTHTRQLLPYASRAFKMKDGSLLALLGDGVTGTLQNI